MYCVNRSLCEGRIEEVTDLVFEFLVRGMVVCNSCLHDIFLRATRSPIR